MRKLQDYSFFIFLLNFFKFTAIKSIKLYQKILSPDHGLFRHYHPYGFCRFQPSCSDYAILAIEKYGLVKGGLKTIWRIMRCNPFNPGGWDGI
jgi:putative membrane protein insertion efficiency factor